MIRQVGWALLPTLRVRQVPAVASTPGLVSPAHARQSEGQPQEAVMTGNSALGTMFGAANVDTFMGCRVAGTCRGCRLRWR